MAVGMRLEVRMNHHSVCMYAKRYIRKYKKKENKKKTKGTDDCKHSRKIVYQPGNNASLRPTDAVQVGEKKQKKKKSRRWDSQQGEPAALQVNAQDKHHKKFLSEIGLVAINNIKHLTSLLAYVSLLTSSPAS